MSQGGPKPSACYIERQALTRSPATPATPSGLDSAHAFGQNAPAQGTATPGDGLILNNLMAIVVSVWPNTGKTLSGAGSLLCWVYNPFLTSPSGTVMGWSRCPDLDLTLSITSGLPAQTFSTILNPEPVGDDSELRRQLHHCQRWLRRAGPPRRLQFCSRHGHRLKGAAVLLSQAMWAKFLGRFHLRGATSANPTALLQILGNGPSAGQMATGSLVADSGQTVSCSRAASAYCLDNSGVLHLLGANTVRVEPNGILVEGASTNLVFPSNNIGGGAIWSAVGSGIAAPTVTQNTTDVTAPDGTNTATKLVYPASTAPEQYSLMYFSDGTASVKTWSVYLRGTTNQTFYISASGTSFTYTACALTTSWQRFTVTSVSAPQYFFIGTDTRAAASNDPLMAAQTVYAWGAQGEANAFASSLIKTTTASASRDADVVSVANPLSGANFAFGASITPEVSAWGVGPAFQEVFTAGANSVPNSWSLQFNATAGTLSTNTYNVSGTNAGVTSNSVPSVAPHRVVVTISSGVISQFLDGSSYASTPFGAGNNVISTQPGTLVLGAFGNATNAFNGWLNRIYVDPNPAKVPLV